MSRVLTIICNHYRASFSSQVPLLHCYSFTLGTWNLCRHWYFGILWNQKKKGGLSDGSSGNIWDMTANLFWLGHVADKKNLWFVLLLCCTLGFYSIISTTHSCLQWQSSIILIHFHMPDSLWHLCTLQTKSSKTIGDRWPEVWNTPFTHYSTGVSSLLHTIFIG